MTMLSEVETTLGQRIQAEIKRNRMSMRALARVMDVAQPTVFKWYHDITEPRLQHLRRMAEIFKISPLWLIYGAESQEEETSAAPDAAMIISKDGMKYVDSPSCLYVQVKLDEMSPTLEVGDTAVVDRSVKAIDQTGIYWVKVSGESMLRRFRRALDGSIRVSCDNSSKYPEVEILGSESSIEVMGRVVSRVSVERVS